MSETRPSALAAPDPWHAPCCYWFWHSVPSDAEIDEQVDRMARAGYRSFQIQPRRAFPLEDYLSEGYFAAYGRALRRAHDHGMIAGVYDDYNWQTGQAAGRAVRAGDRHRERQAFWTTATVTGPLLGLRVSGIVSSTEHMGEGGMSWHYDGSTVAWDEWELLLVAGLTAEGVVDLTARASLAASDPDGALIEIDTAGLPAGTEVTAFVGARCRTSRLINYLDADSVAAFVTAGYQPYFDHLGEHFGSTIAYFFFDQPHANFYDWNERHGELFAAFPFSHSWWAALRSDAGAGLPAMLLALVRDVGQETTRLRIRFYRHHGEWARRTFLGALSAWTREHGVLFSGHEVLGHVGGWSLGRAFSTWDLRVNFGLDYFAIDGYRDRTGVDGEGSRPQLSAKLGDSVARWNGRSGTMLEQYFGSPPGTEAFSGHWGLTLEELRRATLRNHILGMRQLIFHGFYQTDGNDVDPRVLSNPRFDFPPGINYEPWFDEYHSDFALESGRLSELLDEAEPDRPVAVLYPLATLLADGSGSPASAHTGLWCERLFRAGIGYDLVPEEALGRLAERYRALVLPGVRVLAEESHWAAVRAFAESGGRVVASGEPPETDAPVERSDEVPGIPALIALFESLHAPAVPGLSFESEELAIWRGATAEGPRLAIFNESSTERALVRIGSEQARLRSWDLLAGGIRPRPLGNGALELAPNELVVVDLVAGDPAEAGTAAAPAQRPSAPVTIDSGWTLAALPSAEEVPVDPRVGWERQGLPRFVGTGRYRAVFELDAARIGAPARLLLPRIAGAARARMNGWELGGRYFAPFVFEVPASALVAGSNLVELEVTNTAANGYYAGEIFHRDPEPSGLLAAPVLELAISPTPEEHQEKDE